MTDYQRGYYYGLYKKRVHDDQMLAQKLIGVMFAVIGIGMQFTVGMIEFFLASAWIIVMGLYLILTRKLYL